MTPHELAEKICNQLILERCTGQGEFDVFVAKLESLLSAALEETVNNERKNIYVSSADGDRVVRMIKEAKAAGYAEGLKAGTNGGPIIDKVVVTAKQLAYEDAAKIAEDHDCQDPYACHAGQQAEKLRAKAGEVGSD